MNPFKRRLRAGERLVGFEVDLADPCIAEMVGNLGFDYLWIDTEHEAMDYETVLMQIIACHSAGTASLVRIPWNEPYLAKRVLEMGPDGIIFPMVQTASEAKRAMDACLYPPLGTRGFGPRRACQYGAENLDDYIQRSPDQFCRFIQIESVQAVAELDEILKVPYLDGCIIGPCDLSGSIGRLNEIYHPEVLALVDEAVKKCKKACMPVGIAVGSTAREDMEFWRERGIQFISAGSDIGAIVQAAQNQVRMMKDVFSA